MNPPTLVVSIIAASTVAAAAGALALQPGGAAAGTSTQARLVAHDIPGQFAMADLADPKNKQPRHRRRTGLHRTTHQRQPDGRPSEQRRLRRRRTPSSVPGQRNDGLGPRQNHLRRPRIPAAPLHPGRNRRHRRLPQSHRQDRLRLRPQLAGAHRGAAPLIRHTLPDSNAKTLTWCFGRFANHRLSQAGRSDARCPCRSFLPPRLAAVTSRNAISCS